MADSITDLLFRIAADSSQAQGDLQTFRGAVAANVSGMGGEFTGLSTTAMASFRGAMAQMAADSKAATTSILYDWAGNPIKQVTKDFAGMGDAAVGAARRTTSETAQARQAIRGLGEEIGVRMPRFVGSWLTSLGPVSSVMSGAFTTIAVIGLVEVLAKIPETIQKGIDWLHGWTEASKTAFEESTKHALKWQMDVIEINERLRAIQLIGKEGAEKYNLELLINSKNLTEVANKLDELHAKQTALQGLVNWKPPQQSAAQQLGGLSLTGESTGVKNTVPVGPSHEDIEKAKVQLKELEPVVETVQAKWMDLSIKAKEITAEGAADATKRAQKSLEDFRGLSTVLEQVQQRMAGMGTEEEKAAFEIGKMGDEADRARVKLAQLNAEGKLDPQVFAREIAAGEEAKAKLPVLQEQILAAVKQKRDEAAQQASDALRAELAAHQVQTVEMQEQAWNALMDKRRDQYAKEKTLTQENIDLIAALRKAGLEKIRREAQQAGDQATGELQQRLTKDQVVTLEGQERAWNEEVDHLRASYQEKRQLTAANEAMIAAIRQQGLDKIRRDAAVAYQSEMAALGEQLQRIVQANETPEQRIVGQYQADVAKFSAAEEKKTLTLATTDAQRTAIAGMYAAIRAALLGKEASDLQTLRNSQGWQGVLGAPFGQMIRGNGDLWREWATSANQSHMMVRASLEGLKEVGQQTFGQLAQGMGSNIANAFVYEKSIGQAMRSALTSTLESLAAQSITYAIYSTALGFLRLAQYDFAGAEAAFTSAAIWGSVGAAAAVSGRAIAPQQGGSEGAATPGGLPSQTSASAQQQNMQTAAVGATASSGGRHVTVNVFGHVVGPSGIAEFAGMINDAVLNEDVTLTATNTKNGVQVIR